MKSTTVDDFYKEIRTQGPPPDGNAVGHFNVFDIRQVVANNKEKPVMPYNRRTYYKISLIVGKNRAEYADKIINIDPFALLFATPKVPYHYVPQEGKQSGYFCIFTRTFMEGGGIVVDDLPLFRSGGCPVYSIAASHVKEIRAIFHKMRREMSSAYAFKQDLLRNYVLELIHYGQKLEPATALKPTKNAADRVVSLFTELLERQFPVALPDRRLALTSAKDYAERLAVHVNHLNKVLKQTTGETTTALIKKRTLQEAKILLKQTRWSISEISYALGFEEVAHFSNFFKKETSITPLAFRSL